MAVKEFDRFVASQQAQTEAETDWAKLRHEWLKDLDSLYGQISDFLRKYVEDRTITYKFTKIELSEPFIGRYVADRMDIDIGRQHVSLVPIGTLLVGYRGRVDVEGSAGSGQIVLVDKNARRPGDLFKVKVSATAGPFPTAVALKQVSWVWKTVTNNAVQRTFVDLEKESFFELLMEIANA